MVRTADRAEMTPGADAKPAAELRR